MDKYMESARIGDYSILQDHQLVVSVDIDKMASVIIKEIHALNYCEIMFFYETFQHFSTKDEVKQCIVSNFLVEIESPIQVSGYCKDTMPLGEILSLYYDKNSNVEIIDYLDDIVEMALLEITRLAVA